MAETNAKYFNVQDFASLSSNKERITAFWRQIRLSNTEHENDVILEPCFERERANMVVMDGSPIPIPTCIS